ncbi:MAG: hypothetical protein O2871_00910 [bacterium]|nr:hypothetical protein [bacterium]
MSKIDKIFSWLVLFLIISAGVIHAAGIDFDKEVTEGCASGNTLTAGWVCNQVITSTTSGISTALTSNTMPDLLEAGGTCKDDPNNAICTKIASSNGVFQYVFQSIEDPQKYLTPPLSFQYYVNRTIDNNILTKPVYAETFGGGALDVVFGVWKYFRNLAYLIFVVVIIMVGFMVMFRKQIDPHTIVTVQSAIPSFFIVLLLITFSYGIGSLAVSSIGPLYGALKNVGQLGTWNGVALGYGVLMILIVIKFVGVLFVTGAIPVVGISLLIIFLALLVCVVIAGIMYAIEYVKRLVKLIMLTVMAPIILLFGAIPGQGNFISHWFKGIIANVLALPLMYMVIKIGIMIMLSDNANVAWYDFGAGLLNIVIGLVVMFWSAKIPKMVEDMFGYDGSLIPSSDPKRH